MSPPVQSVPAAQVQAQGPPTPSLVYVPGEPGRIHQSYTTTTTTTK
jgi:hypothetical protein